MLVEKKEWVKLIDQHIMERINQLGIENTVHYIIYQKYTLYYSLHYVKNIVGYTKSSLLDSP